MRGISICGAIIALIVTSAPVAAATCPPDRQAAAKLLEGLPNLGKVRCMRPCTDASNYDASSLTVLGTKPTSVQHNIELSRTLSLIFQMPGALSRYSAPFKKTYAAGSCNSAGDLCYWTNQAKTEGSLRQIQMLADSSKPVTYLHCNYELMDF